jgi:hypothetical protein
MAQVPKTISEKKMRWFWLLGLIVRLKEVRWRAT